MGEAKEKRILLVAAAREMEQLSEPMSFEVMPVQAFMLCSMLQVGLRHPGLDEAQPAVREARGFIRSFASNLPPECVAMRQLLFDVAANPEAKCRVCGCTDDHACPGGCSWVEKDL